MPSGWCRFFDASEHVARVLRRFNVPVKEQIEILYELRAAGVRTEIIDE